MILAKYSRVDEDKIKSLSLRLEQLQEGSVRKSRLLDTESTETVAAQVSEGEERPSEEEEMFSLSHRLSWTRQRWRFDRLTLREKS